MWLFLKIPSFVDYSGNLDNNNLQLSKGSVTISELEISIGHRTIIFPKVHNPYTWEYFFVSKCPTVSYL